MSAKLSLFLLFFIFAVTVNSQDAPMNMKKPEDEKKFKNVAVAVTHAELICQTDSMKNPVKLLRIMFDKSLKDDMPNDVALENQNAKNYHVIKLSDGTKFDLQPLTTGTELNNTLLLQVNGSINPNDNALGFGLIANNQTIADEAKKTVSSMVKITIADGCKILPAELPQPTEIPKEKPDPLEYYGKKLFNYGEPENKDTPEIKVNFSLDGTKTTRRYFTLDLDFSPFRLHRLGYFGAYDWERAYLKVRFSNEKAVDTVEIGTRVTLFRIFHDDGRRIPTQERRNDQNRLAGIVFILNPRLETDRRFKEINSVFSWNAGLPINLIQERISTLRIKPYVGIESGYKLKSELEPKDKSWILRPFFGAELYYVPFRKNGKSPLVFEANYIRRSFVNAEPFFVLDAEDNEIIGGTSKGAKDYGMAKLIFNISKIISPFIEYEYGRQPPKFLLINSRYRVGVQTSFDWNWSK